jgi:hypothetical protein
MRRRQTVNTELPIDTEDSKIVGRKAKLEVFGEELPLLKIGMILQERIVYYPDTKGIPKGAQDYAEISSSVLGLCLTLVLLQYRAY